MSNKCLGYMSIHGEYLRYLECNFYLFNITQSYSLDFHSPQSLVSIIKPIFMLYLGSTLLCNYLTEFNVVKS